MVISYEIYETSLRRVSWIVDEMTKNVGFCWSYFFKNVLNCIMAVEYEPFSTENFTSSRRTWWRFAPVTEFYITCGHIFVFSFPLGSLGPLWYFWKLGLLIYTLECISSVQTSLSHGSIGCAVLLETRRSRVQPPPRSATFFRGDWSWNIFYGHSLRSADLRRAVVSFWRKNVHNTG